jgi:hypothetical protein
LTFKEAILPVGLHQGILILRIIDRSIGIHPTLCQRRGLPRGDQYEPDEGSDGARVSSCRYTCIGRE